MSANQISTIVDIRAMLAHVMTGFSHESVKVEDLPDWKSLKSVGVDDLDVCDLIFLVEEKYGVMIPDDIIPPDGATVGWLVQSLAGRVVNGVIT